MTVVTVEQIKTHLNITGTADDALLAMIGEVAEEYVESFLDRPFADYATASEDVPAPLKHAVRMLAGHLYENREATIVGTSAEAMPFGFWDLLAPYRKWGF